MIGLIVARSTNNVIGKKGCIPWNIDGEKQQFKELTTGNVVVMGRKTYEEIGHPLPDRKTIVVSRSKNFEGENLKTAGSVKEALALADREFKGCDVFIAGGFEVYKEAIPYVDVMYITEIQINIEDGDVFFPEFDKKSFDFSAGERAGNEIKYIRTIYKRRSNFEKTDC